MQEIANDMEIQWIRINERGQITACLVERYFSDAELKEEIKTMEKPGVVVKRVIASRGEIAIALKQSI